MSTSRRIDFERYKPETPVVLSGGVISDQLAPAMSDSRALVDVIENVRAGKSVYWMSEGEWSMHQLLMALLGVTGPADVTISSYAMGETPARVLCQLKDSGVIKTLSVVLDDRVDVRTPGSLQLIKRISDHFNLVKTHAKVTLLFTEEKLISVVGSANYTENKRYECGSISCDPAVYAFNSKWITKALIDGRN